MTISFSHYLRASATTFTLLAALLLCTRISPAQTTNPDSGPLKIHVTAVQGGAQYRNDSTAKWQPVTPNLDASEGVEFRTGPKGTIQFTVGSDQVYRVDRLTVVKVLRANLNADGTIRTDVGMTYGRVSKDVDLPQHPHQDTIITPSSTLAVRGTQVGIYDQVPYTPQATSLTGTALYHNSSGQQFAFGSKGGGTNTVSADSVGAAQFQLNNATVAPTGNFSGLTAPEVQNVQNNPGGPPPGPAGQISQHNGQIGGGMASTTQIQGMTGGTTPTSIPGILAFQFSWTGNAAFTIVTMTIQDPTGLTVSSVNPPSPSITGPNFLGSSTATMTVGQAGGVAGTEQFAYGNATTASFPSGDYKLTLNFLGSSEQTLAQDSQLSVQGIVSAIEVPNSSITSPRNHQVGQPPSLESQSGLFPLNATNTTATFNIAPPIQSGGHLTPVFSH